MHMTEYLKDLCWCKPPSPVKYTIVHTRNVIARGLSLSNRNLAIIMIFDNLLSPHDYVLTPVFSFLPVPLTFSLSPILFLSSKYALSPHTSNTPGSVSTKKRKLPYKPPDPEALERAREQRVKEIKMYSIFREIFFYVVYLWVVLVISYGNSDPSAYRMQEDFFNELVIGPDTVHSFNKASCMASFPSKWNWLWGDKCTSFHLDWSGKWSPPPPSW